MDNLSMSAGDMDEVGHFATADYACFGSDLAVRLKNQDDVSPIRKRWLIIERAGRQLGVDAYELWARGYTPLWSAHEQALAPEIAIVDEVRYLIENRTDYLNDHAVIENITRALAGETFRSNT